MVVEILRTDFGTARAQNAYEEHLAFTRGELVRFSAFFVRARVRHDDDRVLKC
jgi:hypothetical protein